MNKTLIGVLTVLSSFSFATVAEASSLVKSFTSTLEAGQEVDESDSEATGTAILNLLQDDLTGEYSLQYKLTVTENGDLDFTSLITPPETALTDDDLTDVIRLHLHAGAPRGENGLLPFNIRSIDPSTGDLASDIDNDLMISTVGGTTMISGLLTENEFTPVMNSSVSFDSFDDIVSELLATSPGQDTSLYWNIHTFGLQGGAIRGQVQAVPEPLTILGAGAAISFGVSFKRKLAKKK
ncbi:MAG: PEP-CTERM sorting domain-containing protein [Crocosphaera sp.]|nr:PEP-CTERM sorting domain-containing protein [Crocosphaera sp.]